MEPDQEEQEEEPEQETWAESGDSDDEKSTPKSSMPLTIFRYLMVVDWYGWKIEGLG